MKGLIDVKTFEDYTNTVDLSQFTEGNRIEVFTQYVIDGRIYSFYTNFLFGVKSLSGNDEVMVEYADRSLRAIPISESVTECIISWCTII